MCLLSHLSLLTLCFLKTFGQTRINLEKRAFAFGENSNSFQESTSTGPVIGALENEIVTISYQAWIKNSENARKCKDIRELSRGFGSLSSSFKLVQNRGEDIYQQRHKSLSKVHIDGALNEFWKTFRIIQALIRNHLLPMTCLTSKRIEVLNLEYLERELMGGLFNSHDKPRPVFTLKNSLINEVIEKLGNILQSISFELEAEVPNSSMAVQTEALKKAAEIKVAFEKCVFESIDLLYQHKIFERSHLERFVSNEKNFQIMGHHLETIYSGYIHPKLTSYEVEALMLEAEFLMTDWKTAHLHSLLEVLSRDRQAQIVYNLILWCIDDLLAGTTRTNEAEFLAEAKSCRLFQHHITSSASTSSKEGSSESSDIAQRWQRKSTLAQDMLNFVRSPAVENTQREYLLSFYLLNFAQTYRNGEESWAVVKELTNNQIFRGKFELLHAGEKLHASITKLRDSRRFLQSFTLAESFMKNFSQENEKLLESQTQELAMTYRNKKEQLLELDLTPNLRRWVDTHTLLCDYNNVMTSENI
ncbi:hypothetical protein O181_008050 [Austropuccinia psidii MF-1]|uniref:Uncharacterized protein n=1 Tax=Austropuccinia psidii MF-1 TaxID=1389203 RepID=A0A9Q3BNL0_9BASI|nr:hypothetical protein [Austropuccinia psidii MF-1]